MFAEIPDATVFYGPDTYMGRNVAQLFRSVSTWSDEEVAALHPDHTAASVARCLPHLRYFEDGMCTVHHMFGGETTEVVRDYYRDAYLTAHFEVPGEMFTLAMQAKTRDMGVVGSTQNILDFITAKTREALSRNLPEGENLPFVLGTETGMVTAIVKRVRDLLADEQYLDHRVEVEIVFPVNAEAVTPTDAPTPSQTESTLGGMAVLPGPAGGEGCSMEGGCASCPYMKMNTLDNLLYLCGQIRGGKIEGLAGFHPRPYEELVGGKTMAQAGCRPILHMRDFQVSTRKSVGYIYIVYADGLRREGRRGRWGDPDLDPDLRLVLCVYVCCTGDEEAGECVT